MSGYWISPNKLRWDKNLSDKQKLILIELSCLCAETGFCWASNEYIGEKLNVVKDTISKNITQLKEKWYIKCVEENATWNDTKRKIYLKNAEVFSIDENVEGVSTKTSNKYIYNSLIKEIKEYKEVIKGWDFGGDVNVMTREITNILSSLDGQIKNKLEFDLPDKDDIWMVGAILLSELKALERWDDSIKLEFSKWKEKVINSEYIKEITDAIMEKGVMFNRIPKHWDIPKDIIISIRSELSNMLWWYRSNGRVIKNLKQTTAGWFSRYFDNKK